MTIKFLKKERCGFIVTQKRFCVLEKRSGQLFNFVLFTRAMVGGFFSVFSLYSFLYMGGAGGR